MASETVDMVIHGGNVVTPAGVIKADVGIDGEKIVFITDSSCLRISAREVINASGKLLLPGIIDAHVHFNTFSDHVDDLSSLGRSAAHGGVTTIIPFISERVDIEGDGLDPLRGQTLIDYIGHFIEEGQHNSVVDYSFHSRIIANWGIIKQIPELCKNGIMSFKVTTGYKKRGRSFADDYMFGTMEMIASSGGLLQIHAENGELIDYLEDKLFKEGRTRPADFLSSRPGVAEADTVASVIKFAKLAHCPIYIVHLSSWEALEEIKIARAKGQRVFAETCPQYLFLTNELLLEYGGLAKIGPPLREKKDNEAIWEGIRQGFIQVVGSDHAPRTKAVKASAGENIFNVPFGAPGTETMLQLIYSEGVRKGRINLQRLAELLSENPAKIYGLYPRKGVIQVGSDADIVIFNPDRDFIITSESQHTNADYTLYEGIRGKGVPEISVLRGRILLENGKLKQIGGYGKFISRPVKSWTGWPF